MAFVPEDGTGKEDANSYIDEAFADSYFDDRGNTVWAALTSPEKQQALVRATDYIDQRFGKKFRGDRESKKQALEWPRLSAFDDDGFLFSDVDKIPRQLQKATAEYGFLASTLNPLLPTPSYGFAIQDPATGTVTSTAAGQVIETKDKVDVIESSRKFATVNSLVTKPGGAQSGVVSAHNLPEYPRADEWLGELLKATSSMELGRG